VFGIGLYLDRDLKHPLNQVVKDGKRVWLTDSYLTVGGLSAEKREKLVEGKD